MDKKENFKRISEQRLEKIEVILNQMKNLTNTSFYEYDCDDIIQIFDKLETEVAKTKEVLLKNGKKIKKVSL